MVATVGGIKAGKAFILIEAIDRTGKVLNTIKHKLGRYAADISSMGATMALRAAAGLTPIALATKTYADFDDSMRRVEARSHGTVAEMEALREQAKLLGRTTAFTASQIGELQAKLAQKGFDRSSISRMTEPIMNLARSGGTGDLLMDATNAADLVSGTIRAFQMDASDATRVSDLMTATINNSNYSLEELTTSLSYAAPAAKNFNMSLEDTLAMLAAMRDLNIDASIAGTAFRNMLNYTSKEAERSKFNDKLKEMTDSTLDFVDAAGNLRNMRDILLALNKATAGLGTAQRTELYDMLFETRAAVPASAVGKSSETIARLLTLFDKANGLSKKTAATMESGLGGSFRELESAAEGVAIAIGEALDNALMSLGQTTEDVLGGITKWIKENEGLTVSIIAIVAGIGLLGIALLLTGQALLLLTPLFTLATFLTGLTASLLTFVAPWALLAAGIYLGARALSDFIAGTGRFDSAVRDSTTSATEFATAKWGEFADYFKSTTEELSAMWTSSVDEIAKALQKGDIETAAAIMLKSLEITFQTSMNQIMLLVNEFTGQLESMFQGGKWNPFVQFESSFKFNLADKFRDIVLPYLPEYGQRSGMGSGGSMFGPNIYDVADIGGDVFRGSIEAYANNMEGKQTAYQDKLKEDMAEIDRRIAEKNDLDAKTRNDQLQVLKDQLNELKNLNAKPAPLNASDIPNFRTPYELDESLKSHFDKVEKIITPPDALGGRGGLTSPDAIMGLERGSAAAAQAFQEAKFNQFGEKLDKLIEAARGTEGHTKDMADVLKGTEGESV